MGHERDRAEEGPKELADEENDSLLTDRQLEVLRLRNQGRSQQEIADILGTTRSNISILEKRAHQNIARAENTIQQWMMICAPVSLVVPAGTDVFDLPGMIFEAADEKGMRLPLTSLDIIEQLRLKAPRLFKKRAVPRDIDVCITKDGRLLVSDSTA
jgi:Tfx family DNA-binding protein